MSTKTKVEKRVEVSTTSQHATRQNCIWCNSLIDKSLPFGYVEYGTKIPVCEDCAEVHNPDAVKTCKDANVQHVMAKTFADKSKEEKGE